MVRRTSQKAATFRLIRRDEHGLLQETDPMDVVAPVTKATLRVEYGGICYAYHNHVGVEEGRNILTYYEELAPTVIP